MYFFVRKDITVKLKFGDGKTGECNDVVVGKEKEILCRNIRFTQVNLNCNVIMMEKIVFIKSCYFMRVVAVYICTITSMGVLESKKLVHISDEKKLKIIN